MSAPVDVLTALQQIADGEGDVEVTALRVRSTVAELIEALRLSDAWIREASHQTGMRATATLDRNRTVLDRVGGAK